MTNYQSLNFNERPKNTQIKYLILHYTGMATGQEALERLCDEQAAVSAHYLIEEDGQIFPLVSEDKRAWHAGVAAWENDKDINGLSIGIELVNPGHDSPNYKGNYRKFPAAQIAALVPLCQEIIGRHGIKPWHVLGHSDVAPDRKCDPGELFDWQGLAADGIGLWPSKRQEGLQKSLRDVPSFQENLAQYGYDVPLSGHMDHQTEAVIYAFQRHFRPSQITGILDKECHLILDGLLAVKMSRIGH